LVNAICARPASDEKDDDGWFIDYMFREVARRGLLRDDESISNFASDPLSFVRRTLATDYSAQATADQALAREQLIWKITHILHPATASREVGDAWQTVRNVYKLIRAARLLRTRVSLHLLQKNIQETVDRKEARKQTETTSSRHDRLKDFWPQFHNSLRLDTPKDSTSFSSTEVMLPALVPSKLGKSSKSLKSLDWKTRGARSHCSAGSWNWLPALKEPLRTSAGPKEAIGPRSASASKLKQPDSRHVAAAKDACGLGTFVKDKGDLFPKLVPDDTASASLLPTIHDSPRRQAADAAQALLHKGKFHRPWELGRSGQSLSTKQYLSACNREGLLPSTDPFVTGHSDCIRAKAQGLSDRDLLAICEMLDMGSSVRELDLEGNASISDRAFLHLFKYFLDVRASGEGQRPPLRSLQKLSLAGCTSLVQDEPFACLIQLLSSSSLDNLQYLNLAGLPIGVNWQVPLCKAIRNHGSLKTLSLADTGFGTRSSGDEEDNTMVCLAELLSSKSVLSLDLSWNCFGSLGFDFFGQKLNELGMLEKLELAHCSTLSKKSPWTSSMIHLLEHLSENKSLQHLNISGNYLDFRVALLLEDSLEYNPVLQGLDVSHNGFGSLGIRSMIRLLARHTSGLQYLNFENCSKGTIVGARTELQIFRASHPHGRYKFDLSQPYDRTLLRMLYKTAERLNVSFDQTFRDITASPAFSHPSKNASAVYVVPQSGALELTFTMDKVVEDRASKFSSSDAESLQFSSVLTCHAHLLRIVPGRSKQVTLLAQWRRMEGLREEQSIMIDALSKDFRLSFAQIAVMCQDRAQIWDVMASLCALQSDALPTYLGLRLVPNSCDYVRMLQRLSRMDSFNPDNPTGRYSLDMSNPVDYGVADSLAILDNWESIVRGRDGKSDVSQLGNYSQARNIQHANCPLPCSLTDWILAESDVLELDYSSLRRSEGFEAVSDSNFSLIMTAVLQLARAPSRCRLHALLAVSHTMHITCLQLRQVLDLFKEPTLRCDAFVMFYNRLVDVHNEKIARLRLDADCVASILGRLGYACAFPFMQPEELHLSLHFKHFDERLLMSSLLKLAGKENLSNIEAPRFTSADGAVDAFLLGVPKSWEQMANIPKHGVLEADYVCRPEQRNIKVRKDLFEQMSDWDVSEISEEGIHFCSYTNKLPSDIVVFATWILAVCGGLPEAFAQISRQDKEADAAQITKREFEDGCKSLGFSRFKGQGEQKRFEAVFAYIDARSEGKISAKDMQILQSLEQDIELCIREVLLACTRLFGDLSAAWLALGDGKEIMTLEEWQEAWDATGYSGPIMQVFKFMDTDDLRSCSNAQFEQLTKYQDMSKTAIAPGAQSE